MADLALVPGGWSKRGQYIQHIWIRYKLTLEEFNKLWQAQNGKCAGCEADFSHPVNRDLRMALRPEVDHDHKTGDVRGLLCRRCNDFLGKVKDNKDILRRLEAYLHRSGETL